MNAEYCCIRFYFQKPGLWDQSGTENDKMAVHDVTPESVRPPKECLVESLTY